MYTVYTHMYIVHVHICSSHTYMYIIHTVLSVIICSGSCPLISLLSPTTILCLGLCFSCSLMSEKRVGILDSMPCGTGRVSRAPGTPEFSLGRSTASRSLSNLETVHFKLCLQLRGICECSKLLSKLR